MVVVEEKRIGSVRVTKPTAKAKPPERLKILGDFLDEHRRVKNAMERRAGAECISRKDILDEIGISEKRLDMHLRLLKNTNLATDVTEDMICSYLNLEALRKRMESMK